MEDGDVIDALLQQACAHLISQCLRSSSRLFRLEAAQVAHGFVHDLFIFDPESHDDSSSTMFFVVPINHYLLLQMILPLNQ
jgi:hypothetical protein